MALPVLPTNDPHFAKTQAQGLNSLGFLFDHS
jgi:hypothetical protein